ncbi:hypothetical protein [Acinetobacter faecalis]|uniref:hypothetical protein n=1 Tax=Acinetobacter faecalis TaxID=2665161 RepID=UPI002A91F0CA|nr:hypothetical protein [Acinetobacter faecalis]MDY6458134.1 hypothetical protein [Acinetobacter faecalis]
MKIIILTLSLLSLTTFANAETCTPSKHAKIPNIAEKSYHQARKQLIANQWQPVRTININTAKDYLMYSGNGWNFWKKGYTEIENCSGTGYAPCVFNFKDVYGNILKIYTEGEDSPKEKIYATISGYEFSCK